MRIENLKVNGFGNLKDKNIELKNGINIITGKNESGKSTLLKFIPGMLYGLAKTKNGKDISDLERYKPWNGEEFSGKIEYVLDNNKKYEVYRDFNKKTCKIYNEKGEEITEEYSMDKSKQSLYFTEQTGITEDILMKTAISEQTETKLDKEDQNVLIQKISNVLSTGSDNTSYKKAISKLKDKQTEEVGTDRTSGRPINIVKSELDLYRKKENEINLNLEKVKDYEFEKNKLNDQIKQIENKLELLKELKGLKETEYLEEEKVNINKNVLFEYDEKLQELKLRKQDVEKDYVVEKSNKFLIIFVVLLVLSIVLGAVLGNIVVGILGIVISAIFLGLQIKNSVANKRFEEEKQEEILSIEKEQEIIEKTIQEKENEIVEQGEELKRKKIEEENILKMKYNNKLDAYDMGLYFGFDLEKIKIEVHNCEERLSMLKVQINTMEVTYRNVLEKQEELPKIKEKIKMLEEQGKELISLNNSINLARLVLEEAYEKMKENITPEFVNNLSIMIKEVSDEKYNNVKFNDVEGLSVELSNGEYVKADKLSIGTIDQMYLSLRLASLKEIVKEQVPVILDEPFVYYDEERLKNVLLFMKENYPGTQIIIFTCADREIEILDKENIEYNLVKI